MQWLPLNEACMYPARKMVTVATYGGAGAVGLRASAGSVALVAAGMTEWAAAAQRQRAQWRAHGAAKCVGECVAQVARLNQLICARKGERFHASAAGR